MNAAAKFLEIHPNAEPCHGGGMVFIGEVIWKRVWVRGGFTQRMADKHPVRLQFTKHIRTIQYSAEFDFEKLGWKEACRLAWSDAVLKNCSGMNTKS